MYMLHIWNKMFTGDFIREKKLQKSTQFDIIIYIQQDATLHSLFYLETVYRCILLDVY